MTPSGSLAMDFVEVNMVLRFLLSTLCVTLIMPTAMLPTRAIEESGLATRSGALCQRRLTLHRNAINPVLEELGDGTFGAIWREGSADLGYAIAFARLDNNGDLLAGPILVTPRADTLAGHALAWDGTRLGVLWIQHLNNSNGLFFRTCTANGAALSGILRIDDSPDFAGGCTSIL